MRPHVLYSDNHLLALNKPAGLLTQPSGTTRESLETQAKEWVKNQKQKPGDVFLHAIHRLDAPVSGIVLFASTSKALSRLNEAVRQKATQKTYWALVTQAPPKREGVLEHYLLHEEHRASLANASEKGAKQARLRYRVLSTKGTYTLLEIEPDTGRYHQIRLQLSAIGSPILGDIRYGGKEWERPGAIALHHAQLIFPHPIGGESVTIQAPLPPDWHCCVNNHGATENS